MASDVGHGEGRAGTAVTQVTAPIREETGVVWSFKVGNRST